MKKLFFLALACIMFFLIVQPPRTYASQLLTGSVSVNNSTGVASGNIVDPDRPGESIAVHFYIDGQAGQGGTFVGGTTSNGSTTQYSGQLYSLCLDGQEHTLYAHGIDLDGPNYAIASTTFTWNNIPTGTLSVNDSNGIVSGSVSDADRPGENITVHFYINGPAGTGTCLGGVQSDGSTNSYSWQLPITYYDGVTRPLYAYAIDPIGPNPLIGSDSFNWAPLDPCDDISPYQGETSSYSFTFNRSPSGFNVAVEQSVQCSLNTNIGTVSGDYSAIVDINDFEPIDPTDSIVDFTKWNWSVIGVLSCTSMICSGFEDNEISMSVTADSATTLRFTWNFNKNEMCVNDWASIEFKGENLCP